MTKQPRDTGITDRFRVHADTSIDDTGSLLRALTLMGFSNIGFELITDVPTFRQNNGKKHEVSGLDFATAWIEQHPSFDIGDLAKAFGAAGRSTSQAYMVVKTMTQNGTLTRIDTKRYQLGGVKALPAPKAAGAAAPKNKQRRASKVVGRTNYGIPNRDLILTAIGPLEEFLVSDISKLFEEKGRPKNSASATMTKLVDDRLVSKLGEGRYRVLAKGKREAAKLTGTEVADNAQKEKGE